MARRPSGELAPIYRVDLLEHRMNAAKEAAVLNVLRRWRRGAVGLAQEQWRLFFGEGRFDKNHPDKSLAPIIGAANRLQMARWHVVGQLKSWVANRANEFIRCVRRSSLSDEDKHMLLRVNACEAWFSPSPLAMKSGALIPDHLRRLARSIMRHCMSRRRRPDLAHTNMVLDQRAATLAPSRKNNSFALWLRLSTMEPGERIEAPLVSYAHFEGRKGLRALSVQVNQDRETGRIRFGVITNIAETCRKTRADDTLPTLRGPRSCTSPPAPAVLPAIALRQGALQAASEGGEARA